MFKRVLMRILDLMFSRDMVSTPIPSVPSSILVIRTDERLGEIILTLPLINHLRKVYGNAEITFLMCKKYESLSRYIDCDEFIFFEKRDLFRNTFRFFFTLYRLIKKRYDLAVVGGKIYPPSLTSYILLGISRAGLKAGIRQRGFNPFVNVAIGVDTASEPLSKYELAKGITGVELPFDNRLKLEESIYEKRYDALVFIDARKRDHLLSLDFIKSLLSELTHKGYRVVVVSGRESRERIEAVMRDFEDEVDFSISPSIDELIRLILMSRSCITGNTGVLHLSVSFIIPTCGIFINADPAVWGYNFKPHLMIDARSGYPELNVVENFVRCSIEGEVFGVI
jgi:ADP-heptose:LPS heptosyltransferase